MQTSNHLSPLLHVPCQDLPDPSFPTVSFPNPEEKGALDESMIFADQHDCQLIIANDPDADRLAAAERVTSVSGEHSWRLFTGNEIGIILGHYQIQNYLEAMKNSSTVFGTPVKPAAVVSTVVSSKMLKKIAATEGVRYSDTLTGFKWIGNESIRLQSEGYKILFSYEEALGEKERGEGCGLLVV
jgi:phosphoglucomutase